MPSASIPGDRAVLFGLLFSSEEIVKIRLDNYSYLYIMIEKGVLIWQRSGTEVKVFLTPRLK